jgi:hypothetical protein
MLRAGDALTIIISYYCYCMSFLISLKGYKYLYTGVAEKNRQIHSQYKQKYLYHQKFDACCFEIVRITAFWSLSDNRVNMNYVKHFLGI